MDVILLVVVAILAYRFNRRLKAQETEIAALRLALQRLQGIAPPPEAPAEAAPVPEPVPPPAMAPPKPVAARPPPRSTLRALEEALAGRWLIWLGGATVALAAAFFIKLSIDSGWLGPGVRVTLGLLSGVALMAGGEWVRRSSLAQAPPDLARPDPVPPALTAAGLFAAFASVYGGFALYDLFPPLVAFALLAALALTAIALSLLQGPYIAALGLLGGFTTPLLVPSDSPSAWGLFAYLLALSGGGMTVVLWRRWRWLGLGTLVGAAVWVPVWYVGGWEPGDALPVGLYLLLTTALFLMPAALIDPGAEPVPLGLRHWRKRPPLDRLAVTAVAVLGVLTALLTAADGHRTVSLVMLGLFGLLAVVVGRRVERLAGVAWVAAAVTLLALAGWTVPGWPLPPPVVNAEGNPVIPAPGDALPAMAFRFLGAVAGYAALYGIGGFVALWGSARAALWSSLSAWVPVALLALAYWRLDPPRADTLWPVASLALAAALVAATPSLARRRHEPGVSLGLAAFAAGAVGALSLGATMMLREAWLTVAIAFQVPVLAWLEQRMGLRSLRGVILLVALVVLGRLALNPFLLEYGNGGLGWILYGYGLPAAGFFLAARWLRPGGDDKVVALLEAGALVFTTLLVSLEIQDLTRGTLEEPPDTLREVALHTLAWLALALVLAADRRWSLRPVAVWGRRALAGLAALQAVLLQLLVLNPLGSGEAVGAWPVANTLLLAYGLPGLLFLLYLRLETLPGWLRHWAALVPLALFGMNLALEIRHAFQGPVLSGPELSDAEWYSYSAGFLALAVLLLVGALRMRLGWLRHVALALMLAVVAKVFLSDMGQLGGLYRVASFLGLGFSLIGVGYLYRRLQGPSSPQPTV